MKIASGIKDVMICFL